MTIVFHTYVGIQLLQYIFFIYKELHSVLQWSHYTRVLSSLSFLSFRLT